MRIGVIGTGNMGSGLGRQLSAKGHDVFMGSRDKEKGRQVGGQLGARGGTVREAAEHGEVVVLAVPWWGVKDSIAAAGALAGKVVVDVTNPYTDATYSKLDHSVSSAMEEIAKLAPGARLVKAFNHVFAQIVHSSPDFKGTPASVFICGDDTEAKKTVSKLAHELGYEPVDAGPQAMARYIEGLAAINVMRAYGMGIGTDQALHLITR